MCDPTSLAVVSGISTAVGAAGSVASSIGAASAQKKQAREVASWQQEQKKFRQAEGARQEDLRQQADAERLKGVEQLDAEAQKKRQAEEEARLTTYLQGDDPSAAAAQTTAPVSVADAALSGQSRGAEDFRSDLAAKINTATKDARARMAALAGVSAYGDSFGGLGTTNKEVLAKSGRGIDVANEMRRGSLGAWGAEKAIDPVQVSYENPLAGAFSTALQVGSQGLGNYFGGAGAGAAAPKADPWGGVRYVTTPATVPRPTARPSTGQSFSWTGRSS